MRVPSARIRILAAAGLLSLTLIGLVVREGLARAQGQEVVLEITGYDPREILAGHYVQFQFRSVLAPGAPCPPGLAAPSQVPTGWVTLRREGDHHVATDRATSRGNAQAPGDLVVRGDAVCVAEPGLTSGWITLNLGVDRLHIDQAQAEAIQKHFQARRNAPSEAYAVISVGRDGKARLKGLRVGGQRFDLDWW